MNQLFVLMRRYTGLKTELVILRITVPAEATIVIYPKDKAVSIEPSHLPEYWKLDN